MGKDCSFHGSCSVDSTDRTDGYKCTCDAHYTGNDCEKGKQFLYIWILVTFKYMDTVWLFITTSNFKNMKSYENLIDPCTNQTCSGNGACSVDSSDATDGYSCACDSFYTGDKCQYG